VHNLEHLGKQMTKMRRGLNALQTSLLALLLVAPSAAQKGGGQSGGGQSGQGGQGGQGGGQGGNQSSGGGGGQGLPGLTFSPSEWSELGLPDVKHPAPTFRDARTVLCFKLAKANSGTQPFVLERMTPDDIPGTGFSRPCAGELDSEGKRVCNGSKNKHWSACTVLDEKHPLLMGQELVIGVEVSDLGLSGVNVNQLKALNINVTNQASSPLNPSPVRPTFPGSSGGGGGNSAGSFGQVQDTEIAESGWIFSGEAEVGGVPWQACHSYKDGEFVTDASHRRLFRAHVGAGEKYLTSGPVPADPFPTRPLAERILDGTVVWQEEFMTDPKGANQWEPGQEYKQGALVKVTRGGPQDDVIHHLMVTIAPAQDLGGCRDARQRTPEVYYYRAMSSGRSGARPKDPLSIQYIPRVIYLPWPYQLPPDVIPTVAVNLIYSPPIQGAPWQGNTFYPAGSVVTSGANTGRYYTALTGGFSDREPREPLFPADVPPTVQDGDLVWLDAGTSAPSSGSSQSGGGGGGGGNQSSGGSGGGKAQQWLARSHYLLGDVILDPYNGHYYTMMQSMTGTSGKKPTGGGGDPFPAIVTQTTIRDGELLWLIDTQHPEGSNLPGVGPWTPDHHYNVNDRFLASNGSYYQVIASTAVSGKSGSPPPAPPPPAPPPPDPFTGVAPSAGTRINDGDLTWMDSGQRQLTDTPVTKWTSGAQYSMGQMVVGSNHAVYAVVAVAGGRSGKSEPLLPNPSGLPTPISDGDLLWMDIGDRYTGSAGTWMESRSYKLNDVIKSATNNRYYQLIRFTAGLSGPAPESPFPKQDPAPTRIADGTIVWAKADKAHEKNAEWKPNTGYGPGQYVKPPGVPEVWTPMNRGISGPVPAQPSFPILQLSMVAEPKDKTKMSDGGVEWADAGVVRSAGTPPGEVLGWRTGVKYDRGDVVDVAGIGNGRYYTALTDGKAGPNFPFLNADSELPLTWVNSGTTAPASVGSGQPADQTIGLINLGLPQTHSLSYFNVAAGVIMNFARNPVFGYVPATKSSVPGYQPFTVPADGKTVPLAVDPASGCSIGTLGPNQVDSKGNNASFSYYCPAKVGLGPRSVDPVLALTLYFPPVDAERPLRLWSWRDWIPGLSFGGSLSNPTGTFYLGGSNEIFVRNVQLFYGVAFQRTNNGLASLPNQPTYGGVGSAPTPGLVQGFRRGFFIGVTYNVSSFLQNLGIKGQ